MPFWLSDDAEVVEKKCALLILQVEYCINEAMLVGALAFSVVCHDPTASDMLKAQCVQNMRRVVDKVDRDLQQASPKLADFVLLRPPALYLQWVGNLSTMAGGFMDMVFGATCQAVLATSQAVDALCPRWGDFVSESNGIERHLAKIQMVDNRRLAKDLPKKLRELSTLLESCGALAMIFGLSDEGERIKETRHIAGNSRAFGTRTVKVAAALKVYFLSQPDFGANVATVLAFQSVLPSCLVKALERKRDGADDADGTPKPKLKRPRGSTCTLGAKGDDTPTSAKKAKAIPK